ncbi:MAG: methionine--tRNA ligase [Planctomycetes bacterium]|nr:methionine--tRNA ligase [Planctomycetota bacterium]
MSKVLVTSALPYANGRVHLGHLAGAYLPADIYVRWRRLKGDDVVFVCGSDEHGVPITLSALKQNTTPQAVVDEYHISNGAAFAAADIRFDIWSRTSSPEHHALAQHFFKKLLSKGFIDKRTTQQYYSEQSKLFLPDRYVEGICPRCGKDGARGDQCDSCGETYDVTELKEPRCALPGDRSTPVLKNTDHWFLKLDAFQSRLEAYVAEHAETGAEPWRLGTLRGAQGWLKQGLRARCITRDTEWGVKIPLAEADAAGKRLYVWFDAPIGYVTFTQQLFARRGDPEGWRAYWQDPACTIYNFIGKDNIPFHTVIWPAMELGYNDEPDPGERPYNLAAQVVANEFLNFGGEKGSKSKGNAVEIGEFVNLFGADPLRYYLTSIAPEENDSNFTWTDFAQRYNGELADVLGNFAHRTLTFTHKYFDGRVPEGRLPGEAEERLRAAADHACKASAESLDRLRFKHALAVAIDLAREGNRYFDERAPWKQRKDDLEACGTTLRICLETAAALGLLLRPFLPESSAKLLSCFGLDRNAAHAPGTAARNARELVLPGQTLGKPEVLFKKVEPDQLPAP